jgi:uncharacterized small protein (DUF1192 family)
MKNLNAEKIKKALECCSKANCVDCPYREDIYGITCGADMPKDALALINSQEQRIGKLTEENERLREDNEIKSQKRANIFEIANAFERGRTNGVRKMQERLKQQRFSDATPHDYDLLHYFIDGVAEEILESDDG